MRYYMSGRTWEDVRESYLVGKRVVVLIIAASGTPGSPRVHSLRESNYGRQGVIMSVDGDSGQISVQFDEEDTIAVFPWWRFDLL